MKIRNIKNAKVFLDGANFMSSLSLLKVVAPTIHRRMEMESYIKHVFPDNYRKVLETIDVLNKGSVRDIEQLVLQIWLKGFADTDDIKQLFDANPYVFRDLAHPYKLMERPAEELLTLLAGQAA